MLNISGKLTIVVPSYNRHINVLALLNKIITIRKSYCFKVLIIDNGSSPTIKNFLVDNNYNEFEYVEIIRNQANIGAGGNMVLAHIQSKTEWTWLLGDDDLPLDNSLTTILEDISNVKQNVFLLKYNSTAGKWPKREQTISNEQEFVSFCSNINYYSNILFISNSVFRTNEMQKYAQEMTNISQTMCPYLLGYLKNLDNGNTIQIKMEHLISHGIADNTDTWDYHKLREGMLSFGDINGHKLFKQIMLSNLLIFYFGAKKRFALRMFLYPFIYKQYSKEYWNLFYYKLALCFNGKKKLYLFLIAAMIPLYYNSVLVNKIIGKKIKSKTVTNNGRN